MSYTPDHDDPLFQGAIKEEYWHKRESLLSLFKATSKKLINELVKKLRNKFALAYNYYQYV